MSPISLGIGPASWLELRFSSIRLCSMPMPFGIEPMNVLRSNTRVCKDLKDPISGAKNPWRDEFDSSFVLTGRHHDVA